jgi:hypothetical protein
MTHQVGIDSPLNWFTSHHAVVCIFCRGSMAAGSWQSTKDRKH